MLLVGVGTLVGRRVAHHVSAPPWSPYRRSHQRTNKK